MKRHKLQHRYGRAHQPPPGSYGTKVHDYGNNERMSTGIAYESDESSPWLALTLVHTKRFRSFKGAEKWLARRGYNAHGEKVRS